MLVVNLFGAPGAGKSTGAAFIFARLKMAGVCAELVSEFAKDKVYEENEEVFKNQAYIFGKQSFKLSRLRDKVDVAVTDAPLLNSIYYNNDETLGESFDEVVRREFARYRSFNIFVHRAKPYNPSGRLQTEAESDAMAVQIRDFLKKEKQTFREIDGLLECYDGMVELILLELEGCANASGVSGL